MSNPTAYLFPTGCVHLLHGEVQQIRGFAEKGRQVPGVSVTEHHHLLVSRVTVLNQRDPPRGSETLAGRSCSRCLAAAFKIPGLLRRASRPWPARPAGGLGGLLIGAEVAAAVLQLLQGAEAVQAPGRGDGAHPKGERHALRQLIHQGPEAPEGASVNGQANPSKLGIPSLEEGYLLGWHDLGDRGGPGHRRQEALMVSGGLGIPRGAVHGVEDQAAEMDQRKRKVREGGLCISSPSLQRCSLPTPNLLLSTL